MLENLSLRQQNAASKCKHPRVSLRPLDILFWSSLVASGLVERYALAKAMTTRKLYPAKERLLAGTVWIPKHIGPCLQSSKLVGGCRRISREIRELIFRMTFWWQFWCQLVWQIEAEFGPCAQPRCAESLAVSEYGTSRRLRYLPERKRARVPDNWSGTRCIFLCRTPAFSPI